MPDALRHLDPPDVTVRGRRLDKLLAPAYGALTAAAAQHPAAPARRTGREPPAAR